jgi:hypothetical protein
MTATPKSKDDPEKFDEERVLAHALVSRGLVTRDEVKQCRPTEPHEAGVEAFLGRLVKAGFLTATRRSGPSRNSKRSWASGSPVFSCSISSAAAPWASSTRRSS